MEQCSQLLKSRLFDVSRVIANNFLASSFFDDSNAYNKCISNYSLMIFAFIIHLASLPHLQMAVLFNPAFNCSMSESCFRKRATSG